MALILIAECEPDLRLLAEQAVRELGHEPRVVGARDAQARGDVLLLAPSAGAVALARALRRQHPELAIVYVGAQPASAEVRALHPAAQVMTPYTLGQLARALTCALALHPESTRNRAAVSPPGRRECPPDESD
jgi:hypothetical protein